MLIFPGLSVLALLLLLETVKRHTKKDIGTEEIMNKSIPTPDRPFGTEDQNEAAHPENAEEVKAATAGKDEDDSIDDQIRS